MEQMRLQSAIEYLTTYGWAILIITITVSIIFGMGLFSPHVPSECIFSSFSCLSTSLSTTGMLTIGISQSMTHPINVTAMGCNTKIVTSDMVLIKPQKQLQIGQNMTETIQCYKNSTAFSGKPGSMYKGYVMINYTDIETGFSNMVYGRLIQKVT